MVSYGFTKSIWCLLVLQQAFTFLASQSSKICALKSAFPELSYWLTSHYSSCSKTSLLKKGNGITWEMKKKYWQAQNSSSTPTDAWPCKGKFCLCFCLPAPGTWKHLKEPPAVAISTGANALHWERSFCTELPRPGRDLLLHHRICKERLQEP